ncbi:hypothetical protein B0H34DRAFT_626183, partial [Crassisporium funariophilum]
VDVLDGCLCGEIVNNKTSVGIIKCRFVGCKTQWYHLDCVSLEQVPRNWGCNACE